MIQANFLLDTLEATERFGEILGRALRAGDVIALLGDLGAGKTTLTQAIAHGMGVTDDVTSPTFTLVQEYGGAIPLFHFDVYRIDADELTEIGFEEYFERGGVVLIEWADRVMSLLPSEYLTLKITLSEDEAELSDADTVPRRIRVIAFGRRYTELASECAPKWSGME